MPTKLLPLQQASVEDLFLLAYVYIDDYLKAAVYSGLFTLPNEPHQKATYAELMTIALVGEWLGEASQEKWYQQVQWSDPHNADRGARDVAPVSP